MSWRRIARSAGALVLCGSAACAGGSRSAVDFDGAPRGTASLAKVAVDGGMQSADRTIIRNASMTVEARDVRAAQGETERIVAAAGGRIVRTAAYQSDVSMTLRVPDPKLDAALDSLGTLGKVTQRGISSEDVTAEVIDLDARVRALQTSRDRLRALHDRTNTVEEIIAVERELARVQGELDSLEGRLRQIRTDAAYSTVQLTLRKAHVLGPLGVVAYGVGKFISKLFVWD